MGQGHAYVFSQPASPHNELKAMQALLSCPVNAIGMEKGKVSPEALQSLPLHLDGPVFINGFNAEKSFAADSYFIQHEAGNWLVDAPRFTPVLVKKIRALGGLRYIFLTHQDDVGDSERYAQEFGATRIIHQNDAHSVPGAEIILTQEETTIGPALFIHVPGHSAGSVCLLWKDKYLFTGDHLPWSETDQALRPFRRYCQSWETQIPSVAKLARYTQVEWVLPGHGERVKLGLGTFPRYIQEAVDWMKTAQY